MVLCRLSHVTIEVETCLICLDTFQNRKSLIYHMASTHKAPFCTICYKAFHSFKELRKHCQLHVTESLINRDSKGKMIIQLENKRKATKTANKLFPKESDQSIDERFILSPEVPVAVLSDSRLFFCHICLKNIEGELTYIVHMKTHPVNRRLACLVCQLNFQTREELHHHYEANVKHNVRLGSSNLRDYNKQINKYSCTLCLLVFETKADLQRHIGSVPTEAIGNLKRSVQMMEKVVRYVNITRVNNKKKPAIASPNRSSSSSSDHDDNALEDWTDDLRLAQQLFGLQRIMEWKDKLWVCLPHKWSPTAVVEQHPCCPICFSVLPSRDDFLLHFKGHLKTGQQRMVSCCGKDFHDSPEFTDHITEHITVRGGGLCFCLHCNVMADVTHMLNHHKGLVFRSNKIRCPYCNLVFPQKFFLKHLMLHPHQVEVVDASSSGIFENGVVDSSSASPSAATQIEITEKDCEHSVCHMTEEIPKESNDVPTIKSCTTAVRPRTNSVSTKEVKIVKIVDANKSNEIKSKRKISSGDPYFSGSSSSSTASMKISADAPRKKVRLKKQAPVKLSFSKVAVHKKKVDKTGKKPAFKKTKINHEVDFHPKSEASSRFADTLNKTTVKRTKGSLNVLKDDKTQSQVVITSPKSNKKTKTDAKIIKKAKAAVEKKKETKKIAKKILKKASKAGGNCPETVQKKAPRTPKQNEKMDKNNPTKDTSKTKLKQNKPTKESSKQTNETPSTKNKKAEKGTIQDVQDSPKPKETELKDSPSKKNKKKEKGVTQDTLTKDTSKPNIPKQNPKPKTEMNKQTKDEIPSAKNKTKEKGATPAKDTPKQIISKQKSEVAIPTKEALLKNKKKKKSDISATHTEEENLIFKQTNKTPSKQIEASCTPPTPQPQDTPSENSTIAQNEVTEQKRRLNNGLVYESLLGGGDGRSSFSCGLCGWDFQVYDQLKSHLHEHSLILEGNTMTILKVSCHLCKKSFVKRRITKHMALEHVKESSAHRRQRKMESETTKQVALSSAVNSLSQAGFSCVFCRHKYEVLGTLSSYLKHFLDKHNRLYAYEVEKFQVSSNPQVAAELSSFNENTAEKPTERPLDVLQNNVSQSQVNTAIPPRSRKKKTYEVGLPSQPLMPYPHNCTVCGRGFYTRFSYLSHYKTIHPWLYDAEKGCIKTQQVVREQVSKEVTTPVPVHFDTRPVRRKTSTWKVSAAAFKNPKVENNTSSPSPCAPANKESKPVGLSVLALDTLSSTSQLAKKTKEEPEEKSDSADEEIKMKVKIETILATKKQSPVTIGSGGGARKIIRPGRPPSAFKKRKTKPVTNKEHKDDRREMDAVSNSNDVSEDEDLSVGDIQMEIVGVENEAEVLIEADWNESTTSGEIEEETEEEIIESSSSEEENVLGDNVNKHADIVGEEDLKIEDVRTTESQQLPESVAGSSARPIQNLSDSLPPKTFPQIGGHFGTNYPLVCLFCGVGFYKRFTLKSHLTMKHENCYTNDLEKSSSFVNLDYPDVGVRVAATDEGEKLPKRNRSKFQEVMKSLKPAAKISTPKLQGASPKVVVGRKRPINVLASKKTNIKSPVKKKPKKPRSPVRESESTDDLVNESESDSENEESTAYHKVSEYTHKCKWCDQLFVEKKNMGKHIARHFKGARLNKLTCISCFCLVDRHILKRHMHMTHEDDVVLCQKRKFCAHCSYSTKKSNLEKHVLEAHPSLLKIECRICDARFSTTLSYNKHFQMTHGKSLDEGDLTCLFCNKQFDSLNQLYCHFSIVHMKKNKDLYCALCCKYFYCHTDLDNHQEEFHQNDKYQCGLCFVDFESVQSCEEHVVVHKRKTDFQCLLCKFYFETGEMMEKHKSSHSEIVKCLVCDRRFIAIDDFYLHRQTSDDNKCAGKFHVCCLKCDVTFEEEDHKSAFEEHVKSHSTAREKEENL